MVDDEIDVDVLADCEVDDTVDVDMKVGNEGDVADDDKDVEEVEALENIVIVEVGKPSLKKKSITFFKPGSDPPPPYFRESVTKIQKKK